MATKTRTGNGSCRNHRPQRAGDDIEAARAARAEKVEALNDELVEAVEALTDSDAWRRMLDVSARFTRYSINNQLLLWAQAEQRGVTLTRVAAFGTWKKLGYRIKAGSKGFGIYEPVRNRLRPDEVQAWIKEGRNPHDAEGRPKMVVRAFKVGYVFDVAQVEAGEKADPLPVERSWVTQQGNTPDGLWDRLAVMTAAAGFTLELRPALPDDRGARGWTNYTTRVVWVGDEHGPAESLRVLAHEYAGHIRADHEGRQISREQRETEADSIAYVVLKALGLDISSSTVDYVGGWLPSDPKERQTVIRVAAAAIRTTAVAVLGEIEGDDS